ncbi:PPE family protein [Mycobacterium shigaense]|uniref:Putative PPE family protein PPE32 n=1 Tax=Mycobacterium shigaense TaxID=722731 RepID=A0A1Z4EFJ7_9MYCO|nr:PPE family protein [Mycobacterium shigaense]MEA1124804.1 PPE family protein [Mycobacterium shigaense]PRI16480.1 hypothetical protein B2J96_06840 [Mycobacterium shigaense]BAX91755.1 putative PPE family protein PPE32 [Mycobacterium shigaense]
MGFGALPPEVNSGRMYVGPGAGPLLAAAAAWDGLSAELRSTAASYRSTVEGLTLGSWQGAASAAMAAAALPYAAWLSSTADQAEQAATAIVATASAYEAAFAATVPPSVIAANRSLLSTLVAANILGQNTPAIAAAEAEYAEMWAQDAAAMYSYAESSAVAGELTPFSSPPQTTDQSGAATQSTAVAQAVGSQTASELQAQLSELIAQVSGTADTATAADTSLWSSFLAYIEPYLGHLAVIANGITGLFTIFGPALIPIAWFLVALQMVGLSQGVPGLVALLNARPRLPYVPGALAPLRAQYMSAVIPDVGGWGGTGSLGIGRATLVGSLSAPQGWVQAAPAMRPVVSVLPGGDLGAVPGMAEDTQAGMFGDMVLSSIAGRVLAGATVHTVTNARPAGGSAAHDVATTATIIVVSDD